MRQVEYCAMAVEEQTPLRLVGKRLRRADSPERLTGQVRYTGDLVLPGLLLRPPGAQPVRVGAHRLRRQAARAGDARRRRRADRRGPARQPTCAQPSKTAASCWPSNAPCTSASRSPSCWPRARPPPKTARRRVQVEYEPLTPAIDMLAGAAAGLAGRAHAQPTATTKSWPCTARPAAAASRKRRRRPTSPATSATTAATSSKAFREADVIVEREYRTPWVHQSYMEPQVCAATVDAARQRRGLRLHPGDVPHARHGGDGARQVAVAGARVRDAGRRRLRRQVRPDRAAGRGVRGGRRPPGAPGVHAHRRLQRGQPGAVVDLPRQGRARARTARSPPSKPKSSSTRAPRPARRPAHAALCLGVFYRWQNLDIDATEVVTHKTPTGAYRAPGLPQAMFAGESLVDELIGRARHGPDRGCARRTPRAAATSDPTARPGRRSAWPSASSAPSRSIAPSWPRRARTKASAWRWAAGSAAPSRPSALCRLESDGTLKVVDRLGRPDRHQQRPADHRRRSLRHGQRRRGARQHGRHRRGAVLGRNRRQQDDLHHGSGGAARRPRKRASGC